MCKIKKKSLDKIDVFGLKIILTINALINVHLNGLTRLLINVNYKCPCKCQFLKFIKIALKCSWKYPHDLDKLISRMEKSELYFIRFFQIQNNYKFYWETHPAKYDIENLCICVCAQKGFYNK